MAQGNNALLGGRWGFQRRWWLVPSLTFCRGDVCDAAKNDGAAVGIAGQPPERSRIAVIRARSRRRHKSLAAHLDV